MKRKSSAYEMEFPDVGNRNFQRRKFRLCRLLASGGGVWYHAYVSDSRKRLVFDIVLRSPLGEGGHRAEADRVIRGGQNLAQAVHRGGGTRSRRVPKGLRQRYATAYSSFLEAGNFQMLKRNTMVRCVVEPCGVLSYSCFSKALTGASRRQNLESAPLNFAAVASLAKKQKMKEVRQ